MTSKDIRDKYIKFFKDKEHKEIAPAKLVPENDPTTLFTSSGMQPLVPYLLGEEYPAGKRLVNSQPCFRAEDIEEVGDNRHTTFFEMLGNWSLGDYFKKEQLPWIWEFLTKELGLPKEKLYVSVFEGGNDVSKDVESYEIWKSLGLPENHIYFYGADKNWWSRSGSPDKMPVGEIGGPDSEIFFEFTQVKHDEKYGDKCHPNCSCGRFLEIGNSVFIEYQKQEDESLKELLQKNVDFGGGLERLTAAVNDNPDIFAIDLFSEAIKSLEAIRKSGRDYQQDPRPYRIITDHLRAAIFMVADRVEPSNKEQGYVLRRLIRRAMIYSRKLGMVGDEWLSNIFADLVVPYVRAYPDLDQTVPEINEEITREVDRFRKTINEGINALKKIYGRAIGGVDPENLPAGMKVVNNIIRVDGNEVFRIYETYGLPPEISQEIMTEWGLAFDDQTMNECKEAMKKHQELSRTASSEMFKGGLADHSEIVTKYHTATHLLHQALRDVLGSEVFQKGSNITAERLRFDFSFDRKMTDEEIKHVEDLVNKKIEEDLKVDRKVVSPEEAKKLNAIGLFDEKYGTEVSIYGVGPGYRLDPGARDQRSRGGYYSLEFCGGPHVEHTGVIGKINRGTILQGKIKITKEEAVSAGIRRIRAEIVLR